MGKTDFTPLPERITRVPSHPPRRIERPVRKVWRDNPRPRGF
jgi:hypothetical protein